MAASSCYVAMSALLYSITLISPGNLRETKLSSCYRHGISHCSSNFLQSWLSVPCGRCNLQAHGLGSTLPVQWAVWNSSTTLLIQQSFRGCWGRLDRTLRSANPPKRSSHQTSCRLTKTSPAGAICPLRDALLPGLLWDSKSQDVSRISFALSTKEAEYKRDKPIIPPAERHCAVQDRTSFK